MQFFYCLVGNFTKGQNLLNDKYAASISVRSQVKWKSPENPDCSSFYYKEDLEKKLWLHGRNKSLNQLLLPTQWTWRWSSGGWWGSWWPAVQRCEARPETWRPWLATTPCQKQYWGWYLCPQRMKQLRYVLTSGKAQDSNKNLCMITLTSKNLLIRNNCVT